MSLLFGKLSVYVNILEGYIYLDFNNWYSIDLVYCWWCRDWVRGVFGVVGVGREMGNILLGFYYIFCVFFRRKGKYWFLKVWFVVMFFYRDCVYVKFCGKVVLVLVGLVWSFGFCILFMFLGCLGYYFVWEEFRGVMIFKNS